MRLLIRAAGVAVAAAVGVSGCSSGASTMSDGAALQLQGDVFTVTTSASAHDWSAARSELQVLRTDLARARAAGTVSTVRAASIDAAIAAVSSDLAAAMRAAGTPSSPAAPQTTTAPQTSATPNPSKAKHGKHSSPTGDGGNGD